VAGETGCVVLAVLRRARGLRGELIAESLGSPEERFRAGLEVTLHGKLTEQAAEIERGWTHNGRLVLKFKGINTRSDAEALEGFEVRIPESRRPPPPEGQHYLSDLIGYQVVTKDGRPLGTVAAWLDPGGPALLEVRRGEEEVLIPLVPEICLNVDGEAQRITVQLPEGLEDLNRAAQPPA
jgi:16S rRNA processing protein RimM